MKVKRANGELVLMPTHCDNPMCGQVLSEKNARKRKFKGLYIYACSESCLTATEHIIVSPRISERIQ